MIGPQTGYAVDEGDVDAARGQKHLAREAKFQAKRQEEFAYDFGDIPASEDREGLNVIGSAGVQTLQMRDTLANPDQKNWAAVAGGIGLIPEAQRSLVSSPLRVTSNVWVQTTGETAGPALLAALGRGAQLIGINGVLKAQIDAAATLEELSAIDLDSAWP